MNYYAIILSLVTASGAGLTLWGWQMYRKARKTRNWPSVNGEIIQSDAKSPDNDLLPHIVFKYQVEGELHQTAMQFPAGTQPMPEFSRSYLQKYPVASKVLIYYNPENPRQATLEPEGSADIWMILAIGIAATLFGSLSLIL